MHAQARLHVMKARPESPRAAEASEDTAHEGVGPAETIPASDREGVATGMPLASDGVVLEGFRSMNVK
eukprot:4280506-Pleurochrysis_carterae.AAC.1